MRLALMLEQADLLCTATLLQQAEYTAGLVTQVAEVEAVRPLLLVEQAEMGLTANQTDLRLQPVLEQAEAEAELVVLLALLVTSVVAALAK